MRTLDNQADVAKFLGIDTNYGKYAYKPTTLPGNFVSNMRDVRSPALIKFFGLSEIPRWPHRMQGVQEAPMPTSNIGLQYNFPAVGRHGSLIVPKPINRPHPHIVYQFLSEFSNKKGK